MFEKLFLIWGYIGPVMCNVFFNGRKSSLTPTNIAIDMKIIKKTKQLSLVKKYTVLKKEEKQQN